MFVFDRAKFYDAFRERFGPLTQSLVDALNFLLDKVEADQRIPTTDAGRRQLAYILATFKWETQHTFLPIDEHGGDAYFNTRYAPGTKVGKMLGNTQPGDGARFHGRGFVQVTGRTNYGKAQQLTGAGLLTQPDRAKEPDLAYQIAIQGMYDGWFTGKRITRYIFDGAAPDYVNARRVINGTDQADAIANIARQMSEVLIAALS